MSTSRATRQSHPRAGHYLQQLQGYHAFIPAVLPPDPPISIDGELLSSLVSAQGALARLDGAIRTLPNLDLFLPMSVRREAVLSSKIEGTRSTFNDLLAAEAHVTNPPQPADVHEVTNYVRAMQYGIGRLDSLPISVRLIRELHAILMEGVRGSHLTPGELRRTQNWIGPANSTLATATFVPPPAHEVPEALAKLERFLHYDTALPLLIRVGIAHVQFEMIHPFLDGNGRVGRLLIALLLTEQGELTQPVLYLSEYFEQQRSAYYQWLRAVQERGDWEGWLRYFLHGVHEVAAGALETVGAVIDLRERDRSRLLTHFGHGAGSALLVLEELFRSPITTVTDVQTLTGLSRPSANQLVARLEEMGILIEITGQRRNRFFRYDTYVRLFDDSAD